MMAGFYRLSEWVMRLAYVNLLWILFTLVGAVFFGIGPATAAMFAVNRKWIQDEDIGVFKTFWKSYRTEFKRANLLMFTLGVIGFLLYLDARFFFTQEGLIYVFFSYFTVGLFIIYFMVLLYIFPVFVHYEFKLFQYIKSAILFAFSNPLITILMAAGCFVVYYLTFSVSGLIPFFGVSLYSFVLMLFSNHSFKKAEEKAQALKELEKEKQKEDELSEAN